MGRLLSQVIAVSYFCDASSAPTAVRMHIMYMHMAMVVMRIGINIVLLLYRTSRKAVKPEPDSPRRWKALAQLYGQPYDHQNEHIRCCMELLHLA